MQVSAIIILNWVWMSTRQAAEIRILHDSYLHGRYFSIPAFKAFQRQSRPPLTRSHGQDYAK